MDSCIIFCLCLVLMNAVLTKHTLSQSKRVHTNGLSLMSSRANGRGLASSFLLIRLDKQAFSKITCTDIPVTYFICALFISHYEELKIVTCCFPFHVQLCTRMHIHTVGLTNSCVRYSLHMKVISSNGNTIKYTRK